MPSARDKPKRWRPWQFRLRTLMTLMLAVACFLGGWMANDWHRQRNQRNQNQATIVIWTGLQKGRSLEGRTLDRGLERDYPPRR